MTESHRPPTRVFLGSEALDRGEVSRRTLQSRHDRIYRDVYVARGSDLTAAERAQGAWLWSGRRATLAGMSAAAVHGAKWVDPRFPAELYRRNGKPAADIIIHRDELWDDEVQTIGAMTLTTPARTAFDLGRREGRTMAVMRVDALANATGLCASSVETLIERHAGARGLLQLREVISCFDAGAESPQETRTRLVLVDAGLPPPQTQIVVDDWRIDMGYEEFKVGVEYDGVQHWTDPRQHRRDIDRLAELLARGWRIVRVSAELLRCRRDVVVRRVCAALRQAGAEWPVIARFLANNVL